MKVPLSWLKEYLELNISPEEIAESLTLAGLEVDKVETSTFSFSGVVIAKVLETQPHPNADRLQIARVFDGKEEFQVVCGASNCREGLITAFAKLGASLKEPDGNIWKIKKSKIRDIESFGMLCAADELGLPLKKTDGILELPHSAPLGEDLSSLYADTIFDVSLTPNLGHCMSIYGIARELGALLNIPIKKLTSSFEEPSTAPSFEIQVDDKSNCSRYSCRLVKHVKVGPSPDWLVQKLDSLGLNSINNVVDISSYVMMKTGQPLHFFDADCIKGKTLYIRPNSKETKIITLDNTERNLPIGPLVIQDEQNTLAVAGVMGCLDSSISEETKNVLIEAAIFSPISIRKTAKELSLKTDSSLRFEKGLDPAILPFALDLATQLLIEVGSGTCSEKKQDINIKPFIPKKLICRQKRVNSILGLSLSLSEIINILDRLGIKASQEHSESVEVLVPPHRNDINEEIDLIEEVARLYGFNNLPKKQCMHYSPTLVDSPVFSFENKIRSSLLKEGLQEFMTCDLISPFLSELAAVKTNPPTEILSVLQSKSNDYSILRHSLLPGLLQLAKHNYDRGNQNVAGFEVGRVHFKQNSVYQEPVSIGILLTGLNTQHHHAPQPKAFDFFDIKGTLENLLESIKINSISFKESHLPTLQPGRQAFVFKDTECLGVVGEVHPSLITKIDMPQRIYFAELNLNTLLSLQKPLLPVENLPLYPASERDWTITLKKETPVDHVLSCIREIESPLLEKVFLLDLFESEQLGPDRKNVTWRFIYRDTTKTLDIQTVEKEHTKLIQMVAEKLHNCIL
jgi:phenylalanyl-tRNA synthetase beta chain